MRPCKHTARLLALVWSLGLGALWIRPDQAVYAVDSGDNLLVWIGNGAAPGSHSVDNPGQLVLMDPSGTVVQTLMDVPPRANRVLPCGNAATSPDGRHFAFYVGRDPGALYLMTGSNAPVQLNASVAASTCLGNGTFGYSPDSSHAAYIAYDAAVSTDEFSAGWLHIASAESGSEVTNFEGVTAFDMTDQLVAFVRFYTNDLKEADEAGVFLWNGETELEVATLYPNEGCRFTNARVGITNENRLILLMGHRCRTGETRTSWQFYTVEPSSRSAALVMTDFPGGTFAPYARTNNLIFSPDKSTVYFTVPDGVTAFTVGMVAVDLANIAPGEAVISRNAVMPKSDNAPYDFARNALPVMSPDGRWLAVVVNTPDNEASVNVLDLADRASEPITAAARRPGDTISALSFTPDSRRVVYVAGGNSGADNALYLIELESGETFPIKRGRYGHGVISTDSASIAVMEWASAPDPKDPPYLTLALVDIVSAQSETLFTGATIVQNKVTEPRFAYPLAWRHN